MSKRNGVGWITMACILMSDQLGYGVLCVPSAYRQLGYVGASVAILLLSAITTYTGLLLTRIRTERPDITSYKQLFGYVFNHPLASMYASACVSLFLFAVICSSVLVQANAWNTFFPKTCSFRWVLLASVTTAVLLQIRTIPKIGLVSVVNCICLMIFNVYLLYSFATYIQSGTHKAGRKVPFPSDSVEAWVAVFDILFSFAGHVVFLELMQEMSNPDDFYKSIWLSQGISTALYLFNGIFVYSYIGDVTWLRSPISLSLDEGVGKTLCHLFVVLSFASSALVDSTIFVTLAQAFLQPICSRALGMNNKEVSDHFFEQPCLSARDTVDLENINENSSSSESWAGSLWWLLWCAVTLFVTAMVTAAIGALNDLIGIIASVIACQCSVGWPGLLYYRMHERSAKRQETCYYHGGGVSPCHCHRAHALRSPRFLLGVLGLGLAIFGIWANSVDIAAHWERSASFKLFACVPDELFSSTRGRRGVKLYSLP